MNVRRLLHIAAVTAALFLVSCQGKEDVPDIPDDPPTPQKEEEDPWLVLNLTPGELKSTGDVQAPVWVLPENVRVFEDNGDRAVFSRMSDGTYSGETIRERKDAVHTVLIPAEATYVKDGSYITIEYASVQQGYSGIVPGDYAIAVGRSSSRDISFYPIFGGLLLSFERDDVMRATVRGGGKERLSGQVRIDTESYRVELLQKSESVTIEATTGYLDKGKPWIVILPPVDLRSGFSLEVETAAGNYTSSFPEGLSIRPGEFTPFNIKDEYVPPPPDVISIPDAKFKEYLLGLCDSNSDGEISSEEAATVKSISVSTLEISSLEGIRAFTNLESLTAKGARANDSNRTILGQLTSLNVSGLEYLSYLDCRHNYITGITLGGNTALTTMICYGNSLASLDLSGAPRLETVDAGDCQIASADVSGNTFLGSLSIHNNRLTSLNLENNTRLTKLTCDRNQIRKLDISACTALTSLDCSPMNDSYGNNLLTTLTLSDGMSIYGITNSRSADYIPDGTQIVYVGAPVNPGLNTGLRSMYIETPGRVGIYSKDNWTDGCTVRIVDDAGDVYYDNSAVQVKGRGNSTWGYPKKPYTLRLPEKADLIGTGEDRRWVLLANWMDRTLLRNDVAFELARRTSLEWTPSGEFIELYLNGTHLGNYWLGEKIKTGKSRLQADFLIEMDTYYDATWRFYSTYGRRVNQGANGLPIGVKEPDDEDMTQDLLNQLKALVSGVEGSLYPSVGNYREKMNVQSFIDWYLVHEVTYNGEPNHPKSCYFYFRSGVMYAGPVWDFDWYTFQPSTYGLFIPQSIYFGQLMKDPQFVAELKARWAELKPSFESINDYIDQKADEIRLSEAINWSMWPCTSSNVNGDERMSFTQSITRMKQAMTSRISAMDKAISAL